MIFSYNGMAGTVDGISAFQPQGPGFDPQPIQDLNLHQS